MRELTPPGTEKVKSQKIKNAKGQVALMLVPEYLGLGLSS
jgi:hypothetical protein